MKISKSQLDKAGVVLAEQGHTREETEKAIDTIGAFRASHSTPLEYFYRALERAALAVEPASLVVRRLKRMESIRAKLARSTTRLSKMQDVAGCRAIVQSVAQVRQIVENLMGEEGHGLRSVVDYIEKPAESGYRGVHLIFEYPGEAADCHGLRVEIQIRTLTEHIWATAVETAGIFINQNLKSGEGSPEWLRLFVLASGFFAQIEGAPRGPWVPDNENALRELRQLNGKLEVINRLTAYSLVVSIRQLLPVADLSHAAYFILERNPKDLTTKISLETDLQAANAQYIELEKRISAGENIDAVLVSAKSLDEIRAAYPNYYGAAEAFVGTLGGILNLPFTGDFTISVQPHAFSSLSVVSTTPPVFESQPLERP